MTFFTSSVIRQRQLNELIIPGSLYAPVTISSGRTEIQWVQRKRYESSLQESLHCHKKLQVTQPLIKISRTALLLTHFIHVCDKYGKDNRRSLGQHELRLESTQSCCSILNHAAGKLQGRTLMSRLCYCENRQYEEDEQSHPLLKVDQCRRALKCNTVNHHRHNKP